MKNKLKFGIAVFFVALLLFGFISAHNNVRDFESLASRSITAKVIVGDSILERDVADKNIGNDSLESFERNPDLEADRNYFKDSLEIKNRNLNDEFVRKIAEKRKKDGENVDNVIRLAKLVREERRERVSDEMLGMRSDFVRRMNVFAERNEVNKENVKMQLQRQNEILEDGKEIKLSVNDKGIRDFLKDKNRNSEDFMASLLG